MRTVAAREMLAFRDELVEALGGNAKLSPQQRKLIDLAARTSLYLDHLDAWLTEQKTLINRRSRSVLPVLLQRQTLAEHLARLLDKLGLDRVSQKVGPPSAVVLIPDNGRDQFVRPIPESELEREIARLGPTAGGRVLIYTPDKGGDQRPSGDMANGQHPAHRSPESESTAEIASVELPPRDVGEVMSANEDQRHDDGGNDVERELGLR